ncbi:MAG: DoxX family membrane protein [Bacteroidales bacterium]|nr:DoxX family membrane protein [Bacteroidales bacterium]
MKNKGAGKLGWISIIVAIASAVGIYYVPNYKLWFLAILLLNLALSLVSGLLHSARSGGIRLVCRLLVGGLFIFSSFTKGVDPLGTKYKMLDYFAAYHLEWLNEYAMVLAVLMILAEFLIGICLLTKICPKLATIGGTLFMIAFTAVTLFDARYDMVPDCGCFGTAVKMTNWQTFYKNLVIDAVLLHLLLNLRSLKSRRKLFFQIVIGLIYAALFTGFEIYNYRHLPVVDFMNWKVGNQMNAQPEQEQQIYLTFRNKETGKTQEYLSPDYPWNDSVWKSQWEFVDQRVEGGNNYIGFSALDQDGDDVTEMILNTKNLLMFTSHDVSMITDKEWEKIEKITETARQKGYEVIWITASSQEENESLQKEHPYIDEIYSGDELEIKTIVRFNPGLIWLDDGLVKDKWSAVDFDKAWARM